MARPDIITRIQAASTPSSVSTREDKVHAAICVLYAYYANVWGDVVRKLYISDDYLRKIQERTKSESFFNRTARNAVKVSPRQSIPPLPALPVAYQ